MTNSNDHYLTIPNQGPESTSAGYLHLRHDMTWLEELLGRIPLESSHLLYSKPGMGKSTVSSQIGIDCALQKEPLHTHFILTEQSEKQVRARIEILLGSHPKAKRKTAMDFMTFQDRIPTIDGVPDYLLGLVSRTPSAGRIPDVLIVDSISGNGLHPNSRSYESVYSLIRICRLYRIPVFLIGHATKSGEHAGPLSLSHSVDTVSTIRAFWRFRYYFVQKNRSGQALQTPVTLEMDKNGKLTPSRNSKPMTATARTFLPLYGTDCDVQVSVAVPGIGQKPRIQCPGIPRSQVSQLIQSLEQISEGSLSLNGLNVDVQLTGEEAFRKTLHLPLLMATVASITQSELSAKTLFIGEVDLRRNVRALSRLNLENLIGFLQSGTFPVGTVLVCPRVDVPSLTGHSEHVRIMGIASFDELIEEILSGNPGLLPKAA